MIYDIVITNSCKKDIKKASKQGKNIDLLFEIVDQLSEGKQLEPKTEIINLVETTKAKENAISNQIFYLFTKSENQKSFYI